MGILMMLKEGGGINIDSIGTKIDEDIDLLPDSGGGIEVDRQYYSRSSITNYRNYSQSSR